MSCLKGSLIFFNGILFPSLSMAIIFPSITEIKMPSSGLGGLLCPLSGLLPPSCSAHDEMRNNEIIDIKRGLRDLIGVLLLDAW
jgi:hypothetical protein